VSLSAKDSLTPESIEESPALYSNEIIKMASRFKPDSYFSKSMIASTRQPSIRHMANLRKKRLKTQRTGGTLPVMHHYTRSTW